MKNAVQELKIRAEILHKNIQKGVGLNRLRRLPRLRAKKEAQLREAAKEIRRRDCLAIIAAECGFSNWRQAKIALSGEGPTTEFGSLLCPTRCAIFTNPWFRTYEEAAKARASCQGYLLAHRREFFVVGRSYVAALGLDPADRDWAAIGYDWARPRDTAARTRLYAKLVALAGRE